jgi:hypothetical protein
VAVTPAVDMPDTGKATPEQIQIRFQICLWSFSFDSVFLPYSVQCEKIYSIIKAIIKICALIFGAGLLIPFSCTSSIMAGMLLFIELDTRDLTKGEKPYSTFYVLVLPSGKKGSLEYLSLNQIDPSYNEGYCNIPSIDKKR